MGRADYKQLKQGKIQLFSRMKLKNIFSGEWDSIYMGEGIEFTDIKPFEPGDDLRDLDLITLLQSGEEEIIKRAVGRQMKIFVWADLSGSMRRYEDPFFSSRPDIRDIAIGLIIYSACNAYSPTGLCIFDDEIRDFIPARYGESCCDKIMERILDYDYQYTRKAANISNAIAFMMEKVYKQSMVFYVSDFKDPVFEGNFTELLRPVAQKFDFIPVVIRDPMEKDVTLKRPLNISVKDYESNGASEIYLTPEKLRKMQAASAKHIEHLERNFYRVGIDYVLLDSPSIDDCYQVLSGFFEGRKRIRI